MPESADDRTVRFAVFAARHGWTTKALDAFCDHDRISSEERTRLWPDGVRSAGHRLNDRADRQMMVRFATGGDHTLSDVLWSRFEDNRDLKAAVARLALSDLFHPMDTIRRTARTARLMWRCQASIAPATAARQMAQSAGLVALYSLCVLVWLRDNTPTQSKTRGAVRMAARLLGNR